MKVSSWAGKPADPSMLVNVPRLVTAYFAETPDASVPAQRVSFGTSGHRGSAFDKAFNEWHILAICQYRKQKQIDGPLFVGADIGGVLLTNGWDHHARRRVVTNFDLEWDEFEHLHQLNFVTYEEGKLTLEEYLNRTVFYADRPFTRDQFWEFMTAQSLPDREMLDLVARLKTRHKLRIAAVSNEARELNAYRVRTFNLDELVDCFVSSCFVHVRKPDLDIFRLALDIAQTPPERIVYIENTPLFVQLADGLGIRSVLHTDYQSTRAKLASFGLRADAGGTHEIA